MLNVSGSVIVDPKKVAKLAEASGSRAINHMGAVVRRNMRGLIRKTKRKVSSPGQAPYTHNGALKKSILFIQEDESTVVVGVSRRLFSGRYDGYPMARTHEFGGEEVREYHIRDYTKLVYKKNKPGLVRIDASGKLIFVKLTTDRQVERANQLTKSVPVQYMERRRRGRYPARPFARPALKKSAQFIKNYHK